MKVILAVLCLFLAACGGMPTIGEAKIVRAEIQVPVPCKIAAREEPAWALDSVDPKADEFVKGRAALVEVEKRREYEKLLKGDIRACQ